MKFIKSGHIPKIRNWRNLPTEKLTRGERICAFIEAACVVPEGNLVGKPVKLEPFQVAFILSVYDNPAVTKLAILSMARKNAKTALIAFLMLAHIVGPEAVMNSRLSSGALSRDQASEVFNYAAKSAQLSPVLNPLVKIIPSKKTIIGLIMNTEYRALSAEASTNMGGSGAVICLDELGQVKGATSDFVDALTTSQAAYENPLTFYISTQAPTDADLLSIAIDDAITNKPPQVVCHLYAAEKDCDVMDETQWKAANPALGVFRSFDDMRAQAEKAHRMPSFRNTFRNLLLNQRVASFATFIDPEEWRKCNKKPKPLNECIAVFGGLDLSSKNDLTAFTLVGVDEYEHFHVYAHFWSPRHGLRDREQTDKAPYSLWEKQGFLTVTESPVVDYEQVATDILELLIKHEVEPTAIAFDRWRIDNFKTEVAKTGKDLPLVEFGQGYMDMSPALTLFEDSVLTGKIHHGDNPVLNMCVMNAVSVLNPAGERKLEKRKATGRIDGAISLTMSLGIAQKVGYSDNGFNSFLTGGAITA